MNFSIGLNDLSRCERDYTEQLVAGLTKKEMAPIFYRSVRTIENTIRNVYKKTGCRNVAELSSWYWCKLVNATVDTTQPKRKIILTYMFLLLFGGHEFLSKVDVMRTSRASRGIEIRLSRTGVKKNEYLIEL
jgi:DNA-binding CsgD family transcriptional regulator